MKKIFILLLILIPVLSFSQDTIRINKVRVCNVVYTKSGKVYKKFFKNVKVKAGYIVNLGGGLYKINGKEMKGEFNSSVAKNFTPAR